MLKWKGSEPNFWCVNKFELLEKLKTEYQMNPQERQIDDNTGEDRKFKEKIFWGFY